MEVLSRNNPLDGKDMVDGTTSKLVNFTAVYHTVVHIPEKTTPKSSTIAEILVLIITGYKLYI